MPVLRMSVFRPLAGRTQYLEKLLDELEAHYATRPGYILGFRLQSEEHPGELSRLAVWESREAAQHSHTMAIHSQINLHLTGEHEERVCDILGMPQNLPTHGAKP